MKAADILSTSVSVRWIGPWQEGVTERFVGDKGRSHAIGNDEGTRVGPPEVAARHTAKVALAI